MKPRSQDQPVGWRAGRRRRAFELRAQGWSQRRIARALGVSQTAVSHWLAGGGWQSRGPERRGAKARLDAGSLRQLPDLLSHGAEVWGFRGELWTCARVAAVIKEEFGVCYSRAHTSRAYSKPWSGRRSGPWSAPASATRPPSPLGGPSGGRS